MKKIKQAKSLVIPSRPVDQLIHVVRKQKVIIDADLATLYGVSTKALNQAVRRNIERFPEDFMFQLTVEESTRMRSQFVTASKRNIANQPLAFTEQGIAMLSSVLRSPRAIQMNISIMRAFVRVREVMSFHKDIATRIEKLEKNKTSTDAVIEILIQDIDKLSGEIHKIKNPPVGSKRPIGFGHRY